MMGLRSVMWRLVVVVVLLAHDVVRSTFLLVRAGAHQSRTQSRTLTSSVITLFERLLSGVQRIRAAPRAMPVSAPASDTWPKSARGTAARARRRARRGGMRRRGGSEGEDEEDRDPAQLLRVCAAISPQAKL